MLRPAYCDRARLNFQAFGLRLEKAVCAHDRGQESPLQTDVGRLIRCLSYGKNKNNLIRLM